MSHMDTDPGDDQKQGQGKNLVAGFITAAAVLGAFYLQSHYGDLMKNLADAGYPAPAIIAGIAGLISHLVTWWTSTSLVDIVVSQIKSGRGAWKRIVDACKS